jgi:hypothetical protein
MKPAAWFVMGFASRSAALRASGRCGQCGEKSKRHARCAICREKNTTQKREAYAGQRKQISQRRRELYELAKALPDYRARRDEINRRRREARAAAR